VAARRQWVRGAAASMHGVAALNCRAVTTMGSGAAGSDCVAAAFNDGAAADGRRCYRRGGGAGPASPRGMLRSS